MLFLALFIAVVAAAFAVDVYSTQSAVPLMPSDALFEQDPVSTPAWPCAARAK